MKPKMIAMAALALLVGLPGAAVAQKIDRDNLFPPRQGDGGGGGGGRGNNFGGGGGGGGGGSPRSFDVRPEVSAPRVRNGGGGLANPQIRKPPKFDPPSVVRPNRPSKPDNDRPGFGKPGNNAGNNKPFRPPHIDKPHDNDRKPPRWRPGHRWRVIVVPSIAYGSSLGWCHYHRYRVPGLRFHRDVRCHYHGRWADPSIVYVSGY